ERLATPLVRDRGLEPASFAEAFAVIGRALGGPDRAGGPGRAAVLTGGRLADEDAYALSRFSRAVLRTNDVHARPGCATEAPDASDAVASALRDAGADGIVLCGPLAAETAGAVAGAHALATATGARFAVLGRRSGDRGALAAGLHPALLPGGRVVSQADDRAE